MLQLPAHIFTSLLVAVVEVPEMCGRSDFSQEWSTTRVLAMFLPFSPLGRTQQTWRFWGKGGWEMYFFGVGNVTFAVRFVFTESTLKPAALLAGFYIFERSDTRNHFLYANFSNILCAFNRKNSSTNGSRTDPYEPPNNF